MRLESVTACDNYTPDTFESGDTSCNVCWYDQGSHDYARVMRRLTTYRHRLAALRDSLTCEDSRDRLSVLVDDLDALLTAEGWVS